MGISGGAEWRPRFRELLRMLEADGWILIATKGSHRQYKPPRRNRARGDSSSFIHCRTILRPRYAQQHIEAGRTEVRS